MTDQTGSKRSRRGTAVIVGILVIVVAAVVVVALLTAGSGKPKETSASSVPAVVPSSSEASVEPSTTSSAKPSSSSPPSSSATNSPAPQPTRTAAIASSAPIVKSLTAEVRRTESVKGTANGPGEIAGPALRFTLTITNHTGKRVSLADTVVNVYMGKSQDPAVELSGPGAKDFPSAVADGSSASGVFVFNVPKANRSQVTVTVDTSATNPVVAFRGSAP